MSTIDSLLQAYGDASHACGEWTKDDDEPYEQLHDEATAALAAVKKELDRRGDVLRQILALTDAPNCLADALDTIRSLVIEETREVSTVAPAAA